MDLKEKEEAGPGEIIDSTNSHTQIKKSCTYCHTTTTPLWRVGPAGPKSLCNACGIKYNKKRRALLGLDRGRTAEKGKKRKNSRENCNSKMRLVALGTEMVPKKRSDKQMSNLGEEERAAILLMALSCGSVYFREQQLQFGQKR